MKPFLKTMKIFYCSYSNLNFSVNAVYIKGLQKNGVKIFSCQITPGLFGLNDLFQKYRKHGRDADCIIVGYDSPQLVPFLKLISRKKVIYNALCSMYEKMVVSRKLTSKISIKSFYYWFSDFLAVHFVNLVMLESNSQINYFKKIFKASNKKLFRAWTGVEDDIFYAFNPAIAKYDDFTVAFRGRLLPEAGADIAVKAAKLLENEKIKFKLIGDGMESHKIENLVKNLNPQNLEWIREFLPNNELITIMQKSHLSLGQLSNHERLKRTIPHKAYESLSMKIPYLTAGNLGVRELLEDRKTCIFCSANDEKDLADKILWARDNWEKLTRIGEEGYRFYKNHLTPEMLAGVLISRMKVL